MDSLWKKINLLVKSQINDLLSRDRFERGSRTESSDLHALGKDVDKEIASFRKRINEALEHDDVIQAQINSLQDEVIQLDQQADEAVRVGRDDDARQLIEKMKHVQHQLTMTESDLVEHRRVTEDLIRHVNVLEATVADARRAKESESGESEGENPPTEKQSPREVLSGILKDAQDKVGEIMTSNEEDEDVPEKIETAHPEPEKNVDDDLAARRARLSKKDGS